MQVYSGKGGVIKDISLISEFIKEVDSYGGYPNWGNPAGILIGDYNDVEGRVDNGILWARDAGLMALVNALYFQIGIGSQYSGIEISPTSTLLRNYKYNASNSFDAGILELKDDEVIIRSLTGILGYNLGVKHGKGIFIQKDLDPSKRLYFNYSGLQELEVNFIKGGDVVVTSDLNGFRKSNLSQVSNSYGTITQTISTGSFMPSITKGADRVTLQFNTDILSKCKFSVNQIFLDSEDEIFNFKHRIYVVNGNTKIDIFAYDDDNIVVNPNYYRANYFTESYL